MSVGGATLTAAAAAVAQISRELGHCLKAGDVRLASTSSSPTRPLIAPFTPTSGEGTNRRIEGLGWWSLMAVAGILAI